VTNDVKLYGLHETPKNLEIIGFADDLNYMLFVIYEHQKSIS